MKQKSLHDRKNQRFEQETQAVDDWQNRRKYWRDLKNACLRIEFDSEHSMIATRLWNLAIFWAFLDEDFSKHAYFDKMSFF